MIFKVKEKFWSWGDNFSITNQNDKIEYLVKGQAFSWGDKLSFQDKNEHELAFISQKLMSWKPRYEIFIGSEKFAEVVKEWSWFDQKFTLDVPGPNDYYIEGSFWQHEFTFVRHGVEVARVSKDYWGWTDTYGIEIFENTGIDVDVVPILCTCIVIDQVLHDDENSH